MQNRLALLGATEEIVALTVPFNLRNMPAHRSPSLNLPVVIRASSTQIVAAVPLKPSPRILFMNPTLALPDRQGLGCVNAKPVQVRVVLIRAEFGFCKPVRRKLIFTIRHVFSAKDSEFKHLPG